MIPTDFNEWVECITKKCGIQLSSTFAKKRLAILTNETHEETKKYKELYGEDHLNNIIHWYQQII